MFLRDSLIQDGVIRNFEIIGEASKQLSDGVKGKHPEIPWSDVARFRDFLIHHYMGVNLVRVWTVIETNLPALQKAAEERLKS
ncbi:MAG TPA: HepT-like ribonuclease domain-containing protein [Phycisphaerae bacterium]|nr:HepT-like ribonuclease domain-containing protein [Phycisphaerae bacterium]